MVQYQGILLTSQEYNGPVSRYTVNFARVQWSSIKVYYLLRKSTMVQYQGILLTSQEYNGPVSRYTINFARVHLSSIKVYY